MQNNRILNLVLKELQENYKKYFDFAEKPGITPIKYFEKTYSYIWKCLIDYKTGKKGIYIKIHKKKSHTDEKILRLCKTEFEALNYFHKAFQEYPHCSVVKPIAFFPDYSVIITEEAEGEGLSDIIKKGTRFFSNREKLEQLEKYCFSCGKWLKIFQDLTNKNRKMKLAELGLFEDLIKNFRHWNELGINSRVQNQTINYFEQRLSILGSEIIEISGQHGDFLPFNVIVRHDQIIVLDFPCYKNGTTYYDLARFCSVLLTFPKNPIYKPNKIERMVNCIIEGYSDRTNFSYEIFKLFLISNMVNQLQWEEALPRNTLFQKLYSRRVISFYLQWLQKNCILS